MHGEEINLKIILKICVDKILEYYIGKYIKKIYETI